MYSACRAHLARARGAAGAPAGGDAPAAATGAGEAEQQLEASYKELCKWVNIKDGEYVALYAGREERRGRVANAISVRVHLAHFRATRRGGLHGVGDSIQRCVCAHSTWGNALEAFGRHGSREPYQVVNRKVHRCMQALDGAMNDKEASAPASRALREQKLALLRKLGWNHWAQLYEASIVQSFPADFALL